MSNEVIIKTIHGKIALIAVDGVNLTGFTKSFTVHQEAYKKPEITLELVPTKIYVEELEDA